MKDEWHRGNFKLHNKAVEASFPGGAKQIIFQTTEAGFAKEDAIRSLLNWYHSEIEVHPLIKAATFFIISEHTPIPGWKRQAKQIDFNTKLGINISNFNK